MGIGKMAGNKEPKWHHFVPRGFLKHWLNADRKIICTYADERRNTKKKSGFSTKSVACEEHLYNIGDEFRNTNDVKLFIEYLCIKYKAYCVVPGSSTFGVVGTIAA